MADPVTVKVIDPNKPAYVTTLPDMPRYYDSFQHAPGQPIINVQSVIWSPGDADAKVTITVG